MSRNLEKSRGTANRSLRGEEPFDPGGAGYLQEPGVATAISGASGRMNGGARDTVGFRVAERIGVVRGSGALIFSIDLFGKGEESREGV